MAQIMKGCCVFWIPTIYHQNFSPLSDYKKVENEDISDEVGCPCKLTLRLTEEQDVSVTLDLEEHKKLGFDLKRIKSCSNGFFLYQFETDDEEFETAALALKNPIYHCVKGFYHKHQHHSTDCDSILDAYVEADAETDIDIPDNKPLIFYLRQYEKRFKDFAEQLEYDATYLTKISEEPEYREILYREKYEMFNQRCFNVLGEIIYYQTLLNSECNHSYQVNSSRKYSPDTKSLFQGALNTENAIARIRLIAQKTGSISQGRRAVATLRNIKMANEVLTRLTTTTSSIKKLSSSSNKLQKKMQKNLKQGEKASNLSIRLGWLSLALGFISLLLGILPFLKE